MTLVYLARHGETVWHEGNRYAGTTDVELTERGRAQANALAEWAASRPIELVASSPLRRAVDTAEPAARRLGVEVVTDSRLREVDFGVAEGLTADDVRSKWPEAWTLFVATPATTPLPGGEPGSVVALRYSAALAGLCGDPAVADGELLVVAHRTAMRLWLCQAIGIPLDEYRRSFPRVDNVAMITVELTDDGAATLIRS